MAALVVLRQCISDRIMRSRDEEKQARSTSDAKLVSLTTKHAELLKINSSQLDTLRHVEVDLINLKESEQRLKDNIISLEAQVNFVLFFFLTSTTFFCFFFFFF